MATTTRENRGTSVGPDRLAKGTGRVKILVAEDEPISHRLLEATLTGWGYEVVSAHDGPEALRILRAADAPPLAVMDWMMPGMDGIQVCREVRQQADRPYVY